MSETTGSTTSASSPYRGPPGEFAGVGSKPPSRSPVSGFTPAASRVLDPRPRARAGTAEAQTARRSVARPTDHREDASASANLARPARPTPDTGDDRGGGDALGAAAAAAAASIALADELKRGRAARCARQPSPKGNSLGIKIS